MITAIFTFISVIIGMLSGWKIVDLIEKGRTKKKFKGFNRCYDLLPEEGRTIILIYYGEEVECKFERAVPDDYSDAWICGSGRKLIINPDGRWKYKD